MKIIDLLVKRANGEELPKKIKYRSKEWQYTSTVKGTGYQYYSDGYEEWKTLQQQVYLEEHLNDEIEIIEEDKKIKQLEFEEGEIEDKLFLARYITHNRAKIKELIDEVNKLKEGKK